MNTPHAEGTFCKFYKLGKYAGLKMYRNASEAIGAYDAQRYLAKLGLAPKAYGMHKSGLGYYTERCDFVYGPYSLRLTTFEEYVENCRRLENKPQVKELRTKLLEAGMSTQDFYCRNIGFLRRLKAWVVLDCDIEGSPMEKRYESKSGSYLQV